MSTSTTTTTRKTPARKATSKPATEQAAAVEGTPLTTVSLVFEKETKGAVRFQEVVDGDGEPVLGSLYVRKAHLNGKVPAAIRVAITDLSF